MINFQIFKNEPKFVAGFSSGESVEFTFPLAPEGNVLGFNKDAITFMCSENCNVTLHKEQDMIHAVFYNDQSYPVSVSMASTGMVKKINENIAHITVGSSKLVLQFFDGSFLVSGSTIIMNFSNSMRIEIANDAANVQSLSNVQMMVASNLIIPAGHRAPQFFIDIGDNLLDIKIMPTVQPTKSGIYQSLPRFYFDRPRPVRLGLPVISTVPSPSVSVASSSGLSAAEAQQLENGAGWITKTIYFLVQSTYPLHKDNHPVYLMLSLPNGVDSLAEPVKILMDVYYAESTFYASAWTCSYTFRVEDTVDYVDGISYIGVYTDMTVNSSLPMGVDIGSSTLGEGDNYPSLGY